MLICVFNAFMQQLFIVHQHRAVSIIYIIYSYQGAIIDKTLKTYIFDTKQFTHMHLIIAYYINVEYITWLPKRLFNYNGQLGFARLSAVNFRSLLSLMLFSTDLSHACLRFIKKTPGKPYSRVTPGWRRKGTISCLRAVCMFCLTMGLFSPTSHV